MKSVKLWVKLALYNSEGMNGGHGLWDSILVYLSAFDCISWQDCREGVWSAQYSSWDRYI